MEAGEGSASHCILQIVVIEVDLNAFSSHDDFQSPSKAKSTNQ